MPAKERESFWQEMGYTSIGAWVKAHVLGGDEASHRSWIYNPFDSLNQLICEAKQNKKERPFENGVKVTTPSGVWWLTNFYSGVPWSLEEAMNGSSVEELIEKHGWGIFVLSDAQWRLPIVRGHKIDQLAMNLPLEGLKKFSRKLVDQAARSRGINVEIFEKRASLPLVCQEDHE